MKLNGHKFQNEWPNYKHKSNGSKINPNCHHFKNKMNNCIVNTKSRYMVKKVFNDISSPIFVHNFFNQHPEVFLTMGHPVQVHCTRTVLINDVKS